MDFKYDTWYSLLDLGDIYDCFWEQLPDRSNGLIKEKQLFLKGDSKKAVGKHKDYFDFSTGAFTNGIGVDVGAKNLLIENPKVIIKQLEV